MMTHIKKLASVACLAWLCLNCSDIKAQTTTSHQMGDDGYVNVPLPFTFNFYGIKFQNSWMYDNGVVSFLQPGSQYALSPWQWYAQPLDQVQSKYFIAALWADIAPTSNTKYTTTTDGSSYMKYSWTNIGEYYSIWSGSPRLNSFSTTIKSDGSIQTNYYNLNLMTSNVSVGTVGDPTKGEINQIYSVPFGTKILNGTIPDWTQTGSVDPCVTDPKSSASCPGYATAMLSLVSGSTNTTNNTQETTITNNIQLATPITTLPTNTSNGNNTTTDSPTNTSNLTNTTNSASSVTPTITNPQPKVGEIQVVGSSKPSLSQIMNIIGSEQSRLQQTEKMVADQVKEISAQVTSNAETTALTASIQSMSMANESSVRSVVLPSAVVNSLSGVPGNTLNNGTSMNVQQAFGIPEIQTTNDIVVQSSFRLTQPILVEVASVVTEKKMIEDVTMKDIIMGNIPAHQTQEVKSGPVVNSKTEDNDIAGGTSLTSIAITPIGYNSYLNLNLKDSVFYEPKEIYKNQKTVDNMNNMRRLQGSNDILHQQMVDQQYKGK